MALDVALASGMGSIFECGLTRGARCGDLSSTVRLQWSAYIWTRPNTSSVESIRPSSNSPSTAAPRPANTCSGEFLSASRHMLPNKIMPTTRAMKARTVASSTDITYRHRLGMNQERRLIIVLRFSNSIGALLINLKSHV